MGRVTLASQAESGLPSHRICAVERRAPRACIQKPRGPKSSPCSYGDSMSGRRFEPSWSSVISPPVCRSSSLPEPVRDVDWDGSGIFSLERPRVVQWRRDALNPARRGRAHRRRGHLVPHRDPTGTAAAAGGEVGRPQERVGGARLCRDRGRRRHRCTTHGSIGEDAVRIPRPLDRPRLLGVRHGPAALEFPIAGSLLHLHCADEPRSAGHFRRSLPSDPPSRLHGKPAGRHRRRVLPPQLAVPRHPDRRDLLRTRLPHQGGRACPLARPPGHTGVPRSGCGRRRPSMRGTCAGSRSGLPWTPVG